MTLELSNTHGIFFRKGHFNKAVCSWVTPRLLWSDSGLISTLHPPTLRKAFFFFSEGWTKNQRVCAACTPPLHATQVQGVIPCMLEDGISFFLITFFYCVCLHAYMPQCMYGGQRITHGSGFSPSTKRALGIDAARPEVSAFNC